MADIVRGVLDGASIVFRVGERSSPDVPPADPLEPSGFTVDTLASDMARARLGIGFRVEATPGDRLEGTLLSLQSYLNTLLPGTLVTVHTGGNTTSGNGPRAGWTQLQVDTFNAQLDTIFDLLNASGLPYLVIPITYRDYTEGGDPFTFQDRAGLINQEFFYPRIQQHIPWFINPATGRTWIDWHQRSAEAALDPGGDRYFFNSALDGIHPYRPDDDDPTVGIRVLQRELADGLARVPFPNDVVVPARSAERVTVSMAPIGSIQNPGNSNQLTAGATTIAPLRTEHGEELPGSSFTFVSGWSAGPGAASAYDAVGDGFYYPDARHFATTRWQKSFNGAASMRLTIPEYAGRTAKVQVAAVRATTPPRIGVYSTTEETGTIDALARPPELLELDGLFDEAGQMLITSAPDVGTAFYYFSGLTVDPDPRGVIIGGEILDTPLLMFLGTTGGLTNATNGVPLGRMDVTAEGVVIDRETFTPPALVFRSPTGTMSPEPNGDPIAKIINTDAGIEVRKT